MTTQVTLPTHGVITVNNWTMAPDGDKYLYFWCGNWQIITDSAVPVDGFRSSEKWQLVAYDKKGNVVAIFPGCQVKAFLVCEDAVRPACYNF